MHSSLAGIFLIGCIHMTSITPTKQDYLTSMLGGMARGGVGRGYGHGFVNWDQRISPYSAPRRHQSHQPHKKIKIKLRKKKTKKTKIVTLMTGFFVSGGTQMFGVFKTLHACQKACEISPTCFAGDYNPWTQACYTHGNNSACGNLQAHKALIHFKKVPCSVVSAPRGIVILGTSVVQGLEMKGIDSLQDCIKKCASTGPGVASSIANVIAEGQVCCAINYDFGSHKCYVHFCGLFVGDVQNIWCPATISAPLNTIENPTSVTISLCPPL